MIDSATVPLELAGMLPLADLFLMGVAAGMGIGFAVCVVRVLVYSIMGGE